MDTQLIDRIYESSFVPELWPDVLAAFGELAGGNGGSLFIIKGQTQHWTASPENYERAKKVVADGWLWQGNLIARAFAARHAGFLTELDLLTRDELDLEPLYRDLWRPAGIGWVVGTFIPIPTGENAGLVLTRRIERGPAEREIVDKLDELRPHLARSILMSARLQLERARIASQTLAALGLPALVLNERGKVLTANPLIEKLTAYVHWRAQDRVSLKDKTGDKLLRDAIAAIDSAASAVRSFPVRGLESMMVAHVIPIRLSARDIFVRCAAALVLTPVTRPQAPPVELVQSLFDLTPAEARVARDLATGRSPEDIASDGGVSLNTVRSQVRGVLEKTGCHRQLDVVALLAGIVPPPTAGLS